MTETYGMTRRQLDCLRAIEDAIDTTGSPPSFTELAQMLGLASKSSISRLVEGLVARGHIRYRAGHARSLEVIQPAPVTSEPEPPELVAAEVVSPREWTPVMIADFEDARARYAAEALRATIEERLA